MRARVLAAAVAAVAGVALALLGAAPASAAWEIDGAPDGFTWSVPDGFNW